MGGEGRGGTHRIDDIGLRGQCEEHIEEVLRVAQVCSRIDDRLAQMCLVGDGSNRGHLGHLRPKVSVNLLACYVYGHIMSHQSGAGQFSL